MIDWVVLGIRKGGREMPAEEILTRIQAPDASAAADQMRLALVYLEPDDRDSFTSFRLQSAISYDVSLAEIESAARRSLPPTGVRFLGRRT